MLNTEKPNINNIGSTEAGQCIDELIRKVNSYVTGACMIPMKLPKSEMINIVERAKEWFYKHYEDSVQTNYLVIGKDFTSTDEFKKNRAIQLPGPRGDGSGRIFSVNSVQVAGENMIGISGKTGFIDSDFSLQRLIIGGSYGVPYSTANGESLMYYAVTESYYDLARQMLINPITTEYNLLNRRLKILGETPKNHLVLEVYETISDCSLYSDEIFFRYVAAHTKKQLGTMIMTFGYSLPGRVTLNGDMIRSDAQEEIDGIKEEIKTDEGTDWFLTS